MKNLLILAVMILGTSAMVNAQTKAEKVPATKEVKMGKHKKNAKKEVKETAKKAEAPKMEATKPKK